MYREVLVMYRITSNVTYRNGFSCWSTVAGPDEPERWIAGTGLIVARNLAAVCRTDHFMQRNFCNLYSI